MTKNLNPYDPASLGYPAAFPVEIALKTGTVKEICEAYDISQDTWGELRHDPNFQRDLAVAVEMVKKEGMSFRMKAKLQSENLLKTSYKLIHDPDTPASVRADLIKSTWRCAGYQEPPEAAQASRGTGFSVTINIPAVARKTLEHTVVSEQ